MLRDTRQHWSVTYTVLARYATSCNAIRDSSGTLRDLQGHRFSVQYRLGEQTYCVFSVISAMKSALGRCKKFFVLASTLLYIN